MDVKIKEKRKTRFRLNMSERLKNHMAEEKVVTRKEKFTVPTLTRIPNTLKLPPFVAMWATTDKAKLATEIVPKISASLSCH